MAADERPAAATALLRHRFGGVPELQQHLHAVDGRGFFFYRSPALDLPGGARVLLEVTFTGSEQQLLLRGQVLGRVEGALAGLWLEFPDTRLLKRADQGAIAQRKQRRVGCDVLVEVRQMRHPHVGRLIDLSLGGARMAGLAGLKVDDEVELRVVSPRSDWPSELGRAQIVRLESSEVGTRFYRDQSQSRVAITRLFGALQQSWTDAPEVEHPALCCRDGHRFEPPLPRIKGRTQPL